MKKTQENTETKVLFSQISHKYLRSVYQAIAEFTGKSADEVRNQIIVERSMKPDEFFNFSKLCLDGYVSYKVTEKCRNVSDPENTAADKSIVFHGQQQTAWDLDEAKLKKFLLWLMPKETNSNERYINISGIENTLELPKNRLSMFYHGHGRLGEDCPKVIAFFTEKFGYNPEKNYPTLNQPTNGTCQVCWVTLKEFSPNKCKMCARGIV